LVVLMYVRYPLSLRNVEDLLFERGIDICHETVRKWWNRFGPMFAGDIRKKRVQAMRQHTHWRWHLDEMVVKVNGETRYLWRAVDHEGEVLEAYVTKARDKAAALKFIKKALKRHGRTQAIVTDGLASYGAALKALNAKSRQAPVRRWRNNRAENSHLPFRRRERAMGRFRRMKTLQKFAAVHGSVHNHFAQERHLVSRQVYRERRSAGWPSGGQSWDDAGWVWARCALTETSCRWTDSTTIQSGGFQAVGFFPDFPLRFPTVVGVRGSPRPLRCARIPLFSADSARILSGPVLKLYVSLFFARGERPAVLAGLKAPSNPIDSRCPGARTDGENSDDNSGLSAEYQRNFPNAEQG